jgi:hypothetical protein
MFAKEVYFQAVYVDSGDSGLCHPEIGRIKSENLLRCAFDRVSVELAERLRSFGKTAH